MTNSINEISLTYKNLKKEEIVINSSQKAHELLQEGWNKDDIELLETFKVIYMNNSNNAKGIVEHSKGGITGTIVDIRVIMATALKSLSVGLILAHNHPSGTLKPSKSDIALTKKIKQAAEYFDIKVLDHLIIIPGNKYFSFADEGIL